jgi:ABC-type phosphate/phosphonate transport system substrate-binding protein
VGIRTKPGGMMVAATTLAAGLLVCLSEGRAGSQENSIRIGLVSSIFRDTPSSLVQVVSQPLKTLMRSQTGLSGELQIAGDAFALSGKLKENKVQLGVFHGFEFAWARQKNPGLKPLVIIVSNQPRLYAQLVVKKDCRAGQCGDLKGKVLAIPYGSRGHCYLYLDRRCPGAGKVPAKFFSVISAPSCAEDALDDVVDGVAQAAVIERGALDQFRKDKPERADRLKVLHQSERFPAAVVAYQEGNLDASVLRRFRDGMVNAHRAARGKQLLKLCRISRFEDIPADYDRLLEDIARAYPAREDRAKK